MMRKLKVHLDKVLSKKYSKRNVSVCVGDRVKVVTGTFKGKLGKVVEIDRKKDRVKIEGVEVTKMNGSKALVPVHFSNVELKELNLKDKKRKARIIVEKKEVKGEKGEKGEK